MEKTGKIGEPSGIYWLLWRLVTFCWLPGLLNVAWISAANLCAIPSYFAWLAIFSPVYFVAGPATFWRVEDVMFEWLLTMVGCWNYAAGYEIRESGDDIFAAGEEMSPMIFMPNHQSTADVPLVMTIFTARRYFAERVMWIMDWVFKFTNFGLVAWMHDDFFIRAGKSTRDASLVDLRNHLQKVFIKKRRKCIVLFPEGGFLHKRKAVSNRFAEKHGLPLLENCTLPRTGALETVLEVLGPNSTSHATNGTSSQFQQQQCISKVVDVTIGYPDNKPLDLWQIVTASRPSCVTHVHYRLFDVNDLPYDDPEAMKNWMYNLYVEKDQMLGLFHATGKFPDQLYRTNPGREPRLIRHNPVRFVLLHIFFFGSAAIIARFVFDLVYSFFA